MAGGDVTSRVRFIGDAQQLLATYKAIGAQATALQRQINQVNNAQLRARGLTPVNGKFDQDPTGKLVSGPIVRKLRTEIDALNDTFRTYGETAIRTRKFGDVITGSIEEVSGSFSQSVQATQRYAKTLENANFSLKGSAKAHLDAVAPIKQHMRALKEQLNTEVQSGLISQQTADSILDRQKRLLNYTRQPSINAYLQQRKALIGDVLAAEQAIGSAKAGLPPVPATVQQLGRIKGGDKLLQQLQKQGLSSNAADLYRQNPDINFVRDLEKQVTKVNGSFIDLGTGIEQRFNAQIDKSGKLITRFGGNLSGLQSFLDQTVRNFQKVVQWGVATTVVFSGIALAARELEVLTTLNTNLNRLSITANITREQTNGLFNDLAQVGIRTATPLTEITASADDIALAVREAGKSTQDYLKDIVSLTEAVGIYTNLTGTDTVEATDLLTSSMKQLNLETEDVTGLLSKITAVAGGQSTAIASITEGLAAMAEAARNAGLSVDRTIATVQILSQVTAKSPAEIATAFKNLVGALENPGGIKQLKELNISLISEGNNIIDIYSEIAEKIRTGAIASTEVSGILRNLAGGPRRAPDAAALLSNIDKIAQTEARAVRATNEALIANAKVLDTVASKITQLQAKFDKLVFDQFSEGFEAAVTALTDGISFMIGIVDKIPTGVITAGIQLALFLTALRLGIGVARLFGSMINNMVVSVTGLVPALKAATIAQQQFNAAGQTAGQLTLFGAAGGAGTKGTGRFGRLTGGSSNLKALGAGAAIGAGIGFAGGGDIKSVLASGLSGAGLAALTAPVPLPWLKLGGAIALAAGTLIEFVGNSEDAVKANENAAKSAEKLLGLYATYSEAKFSIEGLEKEQENLAQSIRTLNNEQNKGPEALAQIKDAQKQYIDNALAMAQANLQLYDTMRLISDENPQLAAAINAASKGELRPEQLEEKIRELQLQLLKQSDPTAVLPNQTGILKPVRAPITPYNSLPQNPDRQGSFSGSTAVIQPPPANPLATSHGLAFSTGTERGPQIEPPRFFNLQELEADANKVKDLFDSTGQKLLATFEPTGINIALVSEAIGKLKANNDSLAPSLENTFNAWVQQNSIIDGTALALESYQNRIDALKFFKPEQAAELQKLLDLGREIIAIAAQQGDSKTIADTADALYKLISGEGEISQSTVLPLLETIAEKTGLLGDESLSSADKMLVLNQVAQNYGISLKDLGLVFDETGGKAAELSEEIISAMESMDEFVKDAQANAATESAELQAKIQGGEFKDDPTGLKNAQGQIEQLKAIAAGAAEVNAAYQEAASAIGGSLDPAVQELAGSLTDINGLQDAQSLTTDQLIERLFSLADTYGLTATQTDKLSDRIVNLIKTAQTLGRLRIQFPIIANVDLKGAIARLKALNNALKQSSIDAANHGFFSIPPHVIAQQSGPLTKAIKELEALQGGGGGGSSSFTNIGNSFSSGGGSGTFSNKKPKGSKSGSTKTPAKKTYDVSNVDLPEEIANAANRDALIKQAIKNAKELQAKIPGAGKEAKNDIVELLKGTQRILEVRGVKDDLLRRALEELADIEKKRLEFETKADTIRRVRVGVGDISALANVPVNSRTGVSLGGPEGPINVTLNLNGTVLTPAQMGQFADLIAASLKRQIAG